MLNVRPSTLRRIVHNAAYLPRTVRLMQDWVPFTTDYLAYCARIPRPVRAYTFRNGLQVTLQSPINTVILGEIFLKHDYGVIPEDGVVIDVGAHIGLFALYAASTTRRTRVYAFEPMPANMQLLRHNIVSNALTERVTLHQLGLAAQRGTYQLYMYPEDVQHSIHASGRVMADDAVEIECITLADVFEQNGLETCDLLKMDCEGAEYECLYSTPPDVLARIRRLRLEYHRGIPDSQWGPASPDALAAFLTEQGFHIERREDIDARQGVLWATREPAGHA